MPRSSLCDCSAYIFVSGTITVAALAEGRRNNGIKVVFKNCAQLGSLWQYYRDEIALADNGVIAEFSTAGNSALFKFKQKMTGVTDNNGRKNVEIIVKLKYLSSFWRTLECL